MRQVRRGGPGPWEAPGITFPSILLKRPRRDGSEGAGRPDEEGRGERKGGTEGTGKGREGRITKGMKRRYS